MNTLKNKYGEKINYIEQEPLLFDEFSLTFIGTRRVKPKGYPREFVYYDFVVNAQDKVITVSWSAGTGDIGPVEFDCNNKTYSLELVLSDKLGRLEKDELVVWQRG